MRTLVEFARVALFVVVFVAAANGGQLENRHLLELRLGVWNQSQQSGVETEFNERGASLDANGFTGSISYSHFFSEALAVNLSVGMRSAGADFTINKTGARMVAASVVHILCGVKYYLPRSTYGSAIRPYIMADIGPYIGSQTWAQSSFSLRSRAETETAFGGRIGGGIDVLLGSHFKSGVSVNYHLVSDFDVPIGGRDNHSGPTVTIGFGYIFGRTANRD